MSRISDLREKAATDPNVAFQLGWSLLDGTCDTETGKEIKVRKNTKEGLYWLRVAAEKGIGEAMVGLGCHYGDTAKRSRSRLLAALYWEKKAWRANVERVGQNIAITYSMLGKKRLCHQWLLRGYKRCKWSTRLSLAKTYLCGYGVRRNMPKAKKLFQDVLHDERSHPEHKKLARKYLRMIERGEMPNDNVLYP
ncbi:MAG: sel1 repeat family protein [Kiritimatiellae bacterium]|nr:sel1 repeat family protein [Kiritimatiellia bacterium]